ncbi:MAG TPA: hypothetical protein VIU12_09170 [Chryseolinea sp.]
MNSVPFTIGGIPYSQSDYGIEIDERDEYHAWFGTLTSGPQQSRLAAIEWLVQEIRKALEKEYFDKKHAVDRKRWTAELDEALREAVDEDLNQGMGH